MPENKREFILAIMPVDQQDRACSLGFEGWGGWMVLTTKQAIGIVIDTGQQRCENWGYAISEDNPADFINAELLEVQQVVTTDCDEWDYGKMTVFVNLHTSKGMFQLSVYNEHNGYYGHSVAIYMAGECTETSI